MCIFFSYCFQVISAKQPLMMTRVLNWKRSCIRNRESSNYFGTRTWDSVLSPAVNDPLSWGKHYLHLWKFISSIDQREDIYSKFRAEDMEKKAPSLKKYNLEKPGNKGNRMKSLKYRNNWPLHPRLETWKSPWVLKFKNFQIWKRQNIIFISSS